ncbi:GCN5-related N-acetyltransferase [Cellulomonas flavigena DSM 20109]|uniref:GCN5-related N-acetyltransferase n=1 Tax=Cellulomonas flavigena (strain ATCC 482 / DSM 20109 / BCRC 11376 / JCM 18109 / NBRC 3775 / NCIMB 8073 / NRS 134) TaxID=446466 RepID=D5UED1_CELFN|nr:GNAT family N-acetyltransferase [Cellulomonas flavigena]ADG74591.1 GCN5-related N-acetyltransferase [Cellulomonas flavigena DSM 20109]
MADVVPGDGQVGPVVAPGSAAAPYPAGWEADVVLTDGSTTRLRPIRPDDADALQAFHVGQSERSTYLRFFATLERLPERDLERLVNVDHVARVALVAVSGSPGSGEPERILGVARYDAYGAETAEVAFNIADAHQGKGLASVLLEHLAAAARERGIRRFVAEVLPQNGRMLAVFKEAGYAVRQRTEDGVVQVEFDIDPTDRSLAVAADREHRAEARSMRALLTARSVVVVGPGDDADEGLAARQAARVVAGLAPQARAGRLTVHGVGVSPDLGTDADGVQHHERLDDVPGPVELAVVAQSATRVLDTTRRLGALGVRGLVLVSGGFAEAGPEGLARQRLLLGVAHGAGMRVVGPSSYGLVATHDGTTLDASLAETPPRPGRVGLFCQSAPFAVTLLAAVERRGLGLAQLVSAGHRADVSGNDLMQFWGEDDDTEVVALYLESIGNPRKFSRVARRLASHKPVVVLTAGRSGHVVPPGHAVRPTRAPRRTLDEVMRQSGVIRVENVHQMLDVVQVLAHQPLPVGRRVAVLASSTGVAALVAEAAAAAGLVVTPRVELLPESASGDAVRAAVERVYTDPEVDVVVVVRIPTLGDPDPVLAAEVAQAAARTGRTTVACVDGLHGVRPELRAVDPDGRERTVPAYAAPEDAALALGHAARYAAWRAADRGRPVHPEGVDTRAAGRLVARALAASGATDGEPVALEPAQAAELLRAAGVDVWASVRVHDADEAVAAADRLGWPVAVKTTVPALRHRADLGGVRLDVADADELRADVAGILALAGEHDPGPGVPPLEVQAMAPHGVACVVRSSEDPLFGPVISFGLGGDASDLLGDVTYGVPPLTDVDVAELVRTPRAAPRMFGYRGLPALDVTALEDLVARVSVLADALPDVRSLELNPVVVSPQGLAVLGAYASVAPADRADAARRLARP